MSWLSDGAMDRLQKAAAEPDFSATKYRILREIGRGGMATVYQARDAELDRDVALKVLDMPDSAGRLAARMTREARIVARLEHPGIVPIHDVGVLPDERVFYAMKLVKGERLDAYARKPLPEKLRAFQKICEAVAFAHAQGVLHRDLKPENIMVGAFGEVLVMDWGLAKALDRAGDEQRATSPTPRPNDTPAAGDVLQTDHGAVLGTPGYMAPEQASGQIAKLNEQTDVYALGAILHFLLCATPPADAPEQPPSPRRIAPEVPRPLDAVSRKAMAERQENRYSNALDLRDDIVRYLDGLSVSAYRENPLEILRRWISRYCSFVILILSYLVMRALLLLFTGR